MENKECPKCYLKMSIIQINNEDWYKCSKCGTLKKKDVYRESGIEGQINSVKKTNSIIQQSTNKKEKPLSSDINRQNNLNNVTLSIVRQKKDPKISQIGINILLVCFTIFSILLTFALIQWLPEKMFWRILCCIGIIGCFICIIFCMSSKVCSFCGFINDPWKHDCMICKNKINNISSEPVAWAHFEKVKNDFPIESGVLSSD